MQLVDTPALHTVTVTPQNGFTGTVSNIPNESPDGGYGFMQLTNPEPTAEQIWNWKANVDAGVGLFTQNQTNSNTFWQSQVDAYNNDGAPTDPLANDVYTYCEFSFTPNGTSTHSFADAINLKRYNGVANGEYIRWVSGTGWVRSVTALNGTNYVRSVCEHPD